jgi:hypothetical protein
MASTFSSLKFELIGTGEQDGTWGDTTNTNLGTAIEQAITGSGSVTFTSADVTLTLANSNTSQTARNLRLVLVGTSDGARQLIVPAIEKQYIVKNELADVVTVKNSSGNGVAIPSGKTAVVFNDATNVVDVTTYASNLSLGGALTGTTANFSGTVFASTQANGTSNTAVATTSFTNSAVINGLATLGTMATQNSSNVTITGGSITGITDLAVTDGGTGRSSLNQNTVLLGNGTSSVAFVAPGSAGNALVSDGTTWISGSAQPQGLGFSGEVWYNVTGSRNNNQTYTNSIGYPIMVSVSQSPTFQSHNLFCYVNDVEISNSGGGGNFYNGGQAASFIVPPGSTYRVHATTAGISNWSELY